MTEVWNILEFYFNVIGRIMVIFFANNVRAYSPPFHYRLATILENASLRKQNKQIFLVFIRFLLYFSPSGRFERRAKMVGSRARVRDI